MAQPPPFVPAFSYTDWTANHPSDQQPGVRLDTDFAAVKTTTDAIRTNLTLLQRDDGALANGVVGPDQLSDEVTVGLRSVSNWTTGAPYIANDAAWITGGKLYRCLVAHTAGPAFATDLAAGRWALVVDVQLYVQSAVNAAIAAGQITVGVDTSTFAGKGATNVFTGANTFQGATTFSTAPAAVVGAATSAADYAVFKPTDYGAGKPGVFLRKKAAATAWAVELDDGVGGGGALDLPAGTTIGGATPATASTLATLTTQIRRARNLAINAR